MQELTQPCSRSIGSETELSKDIRLSAPEINFDYALIQRLNPVDLTTRLIPFNLGKLVLQHDPNADLELESGDIVTIFTQRDVRVPQQKQEKFALVEGEVRAPGVYKIQPGRHAAYGDTKGGRGHARCVPVRNSVDTRVSSAASSNACLSRRRHRQAYRMKRSVRRWNSCGTPWPPAGLYCR